MLPVSARLKSIRCPIVIGQKIRISCIMQNDALRIDKWLWDVRLFKSRSLASDACRAGKVKMDGSNVKASKEIKPGDVITVSLNPLFKTVKVKQFPKSRVSAALVPDYMEDLTPQAEYDRVKLINDTNMEYRDRGAGRPTKKQRRVIDQLKNSKDSW
jgi:ribosome-associated heat shock protein Hsp15